MRAYNGFSRAVRWRSAESLKVDNSLSHVQRRMATKRLDPGRGGCEALSMAVGAPPWRTIAFGIGAPGLLNRLRPCTGRKDRQA